MGRRRAARPGFGAKQAVLDFRARHGIEDEGHTMHNVDDSGARSRIEQVRRSVARWGRSKGATVWGRGPFEGPSPAV